jgi:hypothetical protein
MQRFTVVATRVGLRLRWLSLLWSAKLTVWVYRVWLVLGCS